MNRILTAAFVILAGSVAAIASNKTDAVIQLTSNSGSGLTLRAEMPSMAEIVASPNLAGASVIEKDDATSVPVITRWIVVPEGSLPFGTLKSSNSRLLSSEGKPLGAISANQSASLTRWPAKPFNIGPVEVYRGIPVAPISFYPLQMNEDGSGIENSEMELSVEFRADATAPKLTPVHDVQGSRAARMIDALVINPPTRDPGERQSEYLEHILIVHASSIDRQLSLPYVDSLATWKRQMGYKVSIWEIDLGQLDFNNIRDTIRANYYVDSPEPISHLIIVGGDSSTLTPYFPPHPVQGDHFYSLMDEGDQILSDITVGRMYALSSTDFRGIVKRTVLYEREPFLAGGEDWFHSALYTAENIAAPGGQFVPSMIQLGRWIWYRWGQMGYNPIDTLYYSGVAGGEINDEVRAILQNGVSIAISRGWLDGCLIGDDNPAPTSRRNPFVSAITCLSSGVQTDFFRITRINTCTGPIATLAIWGLTHSKTNNCLMGGQVRAMYQYGYTQPGIIQNFSKFQLDSDYSIDNVNMEELMALLYVNRLMGDPTVDVFTDTPIAIRAEHPAALVPGATAFNIRVNNADGLIPDAIVALRDGDNTYVASPGEDGVARFVFQDGLTDDTLRVTITAHNSIPYIRAIPIEIQATDLVLGVYEIEAPHQNYQAGDALNIVAQIENPSQNAVNNISVALSSESPWVNFDPAELNIGNIAAGGSGAAEFGVNLNRSTPDSSIVQINLRLTSGNRSWEESIELIVVSAHVRATGIAFGGGDRFDRGRECQVLPPLRNDGTIGSVALDAVLVSHNPEHIVVTGANAQYSAANPGARLNITGSFTVDLDSTAVPGNEAIFDLILRGRGNDIFRDTLELAILIGRRSGTDPLGPDGYGYICFDSNDISWNKRPIFDWREINPNVDNAEFEGSNLGMDDTEEDEDNSVVVDLPFPFTYYGQEFNEITVCTNGWIAFGADKGMFVDFRNTQIPGVLGPDAQLAVMWDDFIVNADYDKRGVYSHYVADESIFIVEWSKMQVLTDPTSTAQEFQLILKNPAQWPTGSGDGEIIYQYKTFNAAIGKYSDNFYSTIGMKNLDGTDGLQYTYWNQYIEETGSRQIVDGTALLFTTDIELKIGSVSGSATLFEDGNAGMSGVRVAIAGVSSTMTDGQGMFAIENVPIGQYTCTFTKAGYNQGRVAVTVREGENTEANARMTHPTPHLDQQSVNARLNPGDESGLWDLTVANQGNGDLDFTLALRYENGAQSTIPQVMGTGIRGLVQGRTNFPGLEIVDDLIYLTNSGEDQDNSPNDNFVIIMNKQGRELARFHQPSISGYGFRDLAFDGTYLWGGEDSLVVQFDLQGNVQRRIRVPVWHPSVGDDSLNQVGALAWNPEDSTLLMAYGYSPIYEMNLAGEIVGIHRFTLPRHIPNIFGLAWNPGDPDGMPLYAMIRTAPDGKDMLLAKTNYVESKQVKQLATYVGQRGAGLAIGFDWEERKTVAAVISTDTQRMDTLKVFELGPDTRGIDYDRGLLTVPSGRSLSVPIRFSSAGMDSGVYRSSFVMLHNALADSIVIPIVFEIRPGAGVNDDHLLPTQLILEDAYPNPFNGLTKLNFVLPQAGSVTLAIYDIDGREVTKLVDGKLEAGRHAKVWNAEGLSSGIYFARLEAAGSSRVVRTVLLK